MENNFPIPANSREFSPIEVYRQCRSPVNRRVLAALAALVFRGEKRRPGQVNIVVVDNPEIAELNERFLNHTGATDVLAFNYTLEDPLEGEVYVSREQAEIQSREYGVSPRNELSRLVIHGVLHLLGWRDQTPEQRAAMQEREDYYLRQAERRKSLQSWVTT